MSNQNKNVGNGRLHELVRAAGLVPVWALTLCLKPILPAEHPWKNQSMTLQSWVERGTADATIMSVSIWVMLASMTAILVRLSMLWGQP